jgi:hypothetical protein
MGPQQMEEKELSAARVWSEPPGWDPALDEKLTQ